MKFGLRSLYEKKSLARFNFSSYRCNITPTLRTSEFLKKKKNIIKNFPQDIIRGWIQVSGLAAWSENCK